MFLKFCSKTKHVLNNEGVVLSKNNKMLKNFDIFPKLYNNDFKVKTKIGGFLTILSFLFLIVNIYYEFYHFSSHKTKQIMTMSNVSLPKRLPIDIDLYVWNDCENLHLDFTNIKRNLDLDVEIKQKDFKQIENFCFITASGTIPAIPGSFHIGLGKNYIQENDDNQTILKNNQKTSNDFVQQHKHQYLTLKKVNLSHRIGHIWIGDNNIVTPLNRSAITIHKENVYMLLYSLQLVPVILDEKTNKLGFNVLGDFTKVNMEKIRTKAISGIVFEWDFSPLMLKSATEDIPVITLVSRILALFGTFYVFARWIDSLAFRINSFIRRKSKGYSNLTKIN